MTEPTFISSKTSHLTSLTDKATKEVLQSVSGVESRVGHPKPPTPATQITPQSTGEVPVSNLLGGVSNNDLPGGFLDFFTISLSEV
jgi:hypothetical protein